MFYLGLLGLGLFGDILGKHLKSLSLGDHKWYPQVGLSSRWETGPWNMLS